MLGYRYGFNGMERDDEIKGSGNSYTTEFRLLDPRLGRWPSTDPVTHAQFSPYSTFDNNPIYWIDPAGANAGDYYSKDGTHLGNDDIDDDKVYSAESVSKDANGVVTGATGQADLGITHTEFRNQASTVYRESSAYKMNTVTDDLKKEMFSIGSVHLNNKEVYGDKSDKAKEYRALTPSQINGSKFKTTANAAVINAQTGGFDFSFGATNWDSAEQGLFPASNNNKSVLHNGKSFELHMNTMGWKISDSHYSSWKSNVGSGFKSPQEKAAPANFGNYQNKGKMRLNSTAVYGGTIFWKLK